MNVRTRIVVIGAMGTLMIASSVDAQGRTTGSATRAESVVLTDLQARDTKLREAVDGGLKPAVDALKKTLAESIAAAKAALERAKREGTDEAVMAYNATIAASYQHVAENLDAIRAQRTSVTNAAADLTAAVERTRKQFDATVVSMQHDTERREVETEKRRAELEALATKYLAKSNDGDTPALPADVDLKIRQLAVLHDLGAAQSTVLRQGRERLQQWQVKLDQQAGSLTRLQQDAQLLFTRADASVGLLADVAAARKTEIQIGAVVSRVAKLTSDLAGANSAMDVFNGSINELLAQPPAVDADSVSPASTPASQQATTEILKRFSKTESGRGTR